MIKNDKEMIIPGEELNIKKTLESILKRQENMEENFKEYLIVVRERYEQCDSMQRIRNLLLGFAITSITIQVYIFANYKVSKFDGKPLPKSSKLSHFIHPYESQ